MTNYPTKVEELPTEQFYAILTPKTVQTDPEDSRYSDDLWEIEAYTDRAQWESEVKRRSGLIFGDRFKAVIIKPVRIALSMEITE